MEVGNPSGTVYCSPQIEALLGYTPEAYERDPRHWVKVLHPDDRERALGREVVAEGVETGEQLARLRELGFERAQERYFAGSLPSEEVSALLAAGASP